jgi:hypothetical protein
MAKSRNFAAAPQWIPFPRQRHRLTATGGSPAMTRSWQNDTSIVMIHTPPYVRRDPNSRISIGQDRFTLSNQKRSRPASLLLEDAPDSPPREPSERRRQDGNVGCEYDRRVAAVLLRFQSHSARRKWELYMFVSELSIEYATQK